MHQQALSLTTNPSGQRSILKLVDGNSIAMCVTLQVYESCEALFASLADEAKKYQDWLVLGDVAGEMEDHVEQQLCGAGDGSSTGDIADWELNLRMLKTAAHDLNRLPNEVGCGAATSCVCYLRQLSQNNTHGCTGVHAKGTLHEGCWYTRTCSARSHSVGSYAGSHTVLLHNAL